MKKILGLDIGSNSIGWSILKQNDDDDFCGILGAGTRIFEAGIELNEATGAATSKTAERTLKRQLRKMLLRRRRRMNKIRHLLQRNLLLPPEENFGAAISVLDRETIARLQKNNSTGLPSDELLRQLLPYYLRSRALDYNLLPFELGRAIYHLAQRRGFLSNRKTAAKDKDAGAVKTGISDLRKNMAATGARTLGEYFARLDPEQNNVRRIWTARDMYMDEFNRICDRQQNLLPPGLRQALFDALFFQRPLKPVDKLIGECRFEEGHKRCPWSSPEAQEFRYVDEVNNLRLIDQDKNIRKLTDDEKNRLYQALEGQTGELDKKSELTYAAIKKLLKLPKTVSFSIEEGGKKAIKGNQINHRLSSILGDKWTSGTGEFRIKLLSALRHSDSDEALMAKLEQFPQLTDDEKRSLCEYSLPEGYCSVSLKAIRKLIPALKSGKTPIEVYPQRQQDWSAALDQLPTPEIKNMRNPAVFRCLSELRQLVNALIKEYGKPDLIRVELARDLKSNEEQRKNHIRRNRENEQKRRRCVDKIRAEVGIEHPSREDIEKVLLAEECSWQCPYTDRKISIGALLIESQFDIEHIIPYSRCLDNSFANKTLCYHDENRNVKKNGTPYEVYGNDPEKYQQILSSVAKFNGDSSLVAEKVRRFQLKDIGTLDDFCSRQLNDTRYASKSAKEYLGQLYGGVIDADGKLRVQANSGSVSAIVRSVLEFNRILNQGKNMKSRDDHRHHAVDAVAVALSDAKVVKMIAGKFQSTEAEWKNGRFWDQLRNSISFAAWPGFTADIQSAVGGILVSHHVRNRLRGPLHKETFYGKLFDNPDNPKEPVHHCRVELSAMSIKNVNEIVDPAVRQAVLEKLYELGIDDPAKAFKDGKNLPLHPNNNVIKRVRLAVKQDTISLGADEHNRQVMAGNNHHMTLFDLVDDEGNVLCTEGYPVSLYEAMQRKRRGEEIIQRSLPDVVIKGKTYHQKYRMVLFKGDIIETAEEDGSVGLRIIRCVPQSTQIIYTNIADARETGAIKADRKYYSARPNTILKKMKGKYLVNHAGKLRPNNA